MIDDKGFLTIKGKSYHSGTSRFEWEKEIPFKEAEKLLELCEDFIISKKRYFHQVGNHIFEIDEFFEENLGLIIAEVYRGFDCLI